MKKWYITIILFALTIVLVACGEEEQGAAANSGSERIQVNIATLNLPVVAVAHEEGYLQEELAKVNAEYDYSTHPTGPPINEGIAAKRVDLALLGDGAILGGANNQLDTKLISLATDGLTGINTIIATKKSGIQSPEDLKGKKIAVTFGTAHHVFLLKILNENNLTIDDVIPINLATADAHPAFQTNQVDAWVTGNIYSEKEVANGATLVATPEKSKLYAPFFYVARGEFAKQHPEVVKAFLKAIDRSVAFPKTDYDKFIQTAARALEQDVEAVKALDPKAVNEVPTDEILAEFQKSTDILKDLDYIKRDITIQELLDLTFIHDLREQP